MRQNYSLLTAATNMGQKKPGTEMAGDWLKVRGLKDDILLTPLHDLGNINEFHEEDKSESIESKLTRLSKYSERLAAVIKEELDKQNVALTIGGDHSIATGTLAATLQYNPNIKIVWVDAHADLNTPATSPSHNTHGMPVAIAMGLVPEVQELGLFEYLPKLNPDNIVYIGLRDVDQGETGFINKLGIRAYNASDVHERGIESILEETKEYLDPDNMEEIHLSFDVDAIDPFYFPATGTPVPEGLSLADGKRIMEYLSLNTNLIAIDLVEINPLLGNEDDLNQTYRSTVELINGLRKRINPVDKTGEEVLQL